MPSIVLDQVFIEEFAPEDTGHFEDELSRDHTIADADFPAHKHLNVAARTGRQCRTRAGVDLKIRRIFVGELDASVFRGGRDDLAIAKDWFERLAVLNELFPMMLFEFLRRNTSLAGEPGTQFMVTLDIEPNPLVKVP